MKSPGSAKAQGSFALIMAALALSIFFVRFDSYIVNIAMPTFVGAFNITVSQASWITLSYVLSQVSAFMAFGKLCNQFKLKNIFLTGMAIFTAASFLCGILPNFWSLIVFRCIQGIGGSMMLVSSYAAVLLYLPQEKVGWGLSIMTSAAAIGVLLGPVAGGLILHYLDWRWIFFINLPLGLAAMWFCSRVIPSVENPKTSGKGSLDLPGLVLSAAALFLLVYSLNMGCEHGWTSAIIISCEVFAVLSFIAFFMVERRAGDPILDVSIFKTRSLAIILIALISGFLPFFGGTFLLTFYLTQHGLNPKQMGFLMMVFSLVYVPMSLYAGRLTEKLSSRKMSAAAAFLAAVTGLAFAFFLDTGSLIPSIAYLIVLAVAYGMFIVPINHSIMGFATAETKGSISAVFNTAMNITMALGIAIMETVYSEFERHVIGFQTAFCAGAFFCLIAAVMLAFIARDRQQPIVD